MPQQLHVYQKGPKGKWDTKAADGQGDLSQSKQFGVTMSKVDVRVNQGNTYQIRQRQSSTGDLYTCDQGAAKKNDVANFTYSGAGPDSMTSSAVSDVPFALPTKRSQKLLSSSGSDPSSGTLGASGMGLLVSSNEVTQDQATAAYYMQLYGQGSALGQLKAQGKDIDDPKIFQSYDYYKYYISNLRSLGLNVISASGETVNENSYSGSIKVGDILTDILSVYIPAAELADMTKLFELLASTSDTKITDFLNFWWDNASYSTTQTSLALGPLVIGSQQQPSFTVVYYSLDYAISHWRSLFIELSSAKLDVTSSAITLEYDMDLYNSVILPAILPKIRTSIQSHIDSTPFTLG
jgi:hypothetical protein